MSNVAPQAERLAPAETPFEQVWRTFRKDRLAVAGLYVLIALVVLALLGKLLTEVVARRDRIRKLLVASSMSIYGEGQYRNPRSGESGLAPGLRPESQLSERHWDVVGEDGGPLEPEPTAETKPLRPTSVYAVGKRDHEELFLSVGAAYGVLVWIFQDGRLEGVLDYQSNGGVVAWLPMFLFVILFGLSMDYHVFILSRIREAVDRGMRPEDAVAHGIRGTAGTVTSAAFVMVAVFAIFATLGMIDFKMMGVGLAIAVLLDATVVRIVLLPALMLLLGDRVWWLPKPLARVLPKLSV